MQHKRRTFALLLLNVRDIGLLGSAVSRQHWPDWATISVPFERTAADKPIHGDDIRALHTEQTNKHPTPLLRLKVEYHAELEKVHSQRNQGIMKCVLQNCSSER